MARLTLSILFCWTW